MLTPAFGDRTAPAAPPSLSVDNATVRLHPPEPLRAFAVYAEAGQGWTLDSLLPASTTSHTLPPGRWAISAVHRDGHESAGLVVEIVED